MAMISNDWLPALKDESSKLGFGRDLMVSKLQGTWNRLHRPQVQKVDNVSLRR